MCDPVTCANGKCRATSECVDVLWERSPPLAPNASNEETRLRLAPKMRLPAASPALKIYIAGPMRSIPNFNFPAFHAAAAALRAQGYFVFNPAEKDNERHGTDISTGNAAGCEKMATEQHGFNLRVALGDDLRFICAEADAIALLPGWEKSKGATAEHATAVALGLKRFFLQETPNGWLVSLATAAV